MADINWGDIGMGLGAGATQYGLGYYNAQQQQKAASDKYKAIKESLQNQLSRFDQDYSSELSGGLTDSEKANRELLVNKTRLSTDQEVERQIGNLTQQYARAGIGGQELANAIAEVKSRGNAAVTDYQNNLDATLLERAAQRATAAKSVRQQMLSSINSTLTPLAYEAEQPINTTQLALNSFLPSAVAGVVGGVKGYGTEASYEKAATDSLLKTVGLDPNMFVPMQQDIKDIAGVPVTKDKSTGKWVTDTKLMEEALRLKRAGSNKETTNDMTDTQIAAAVTRDMALYQKDKEKFAPGEWEKLQTALTNYYRTDFKTGGSRPTVADDYANWTAGTRLGVVGGAPTPTTNSPVVAIDKNSGMVKLQDGSVRAMTPAEKAQYGIK